MDITGKKAGRGAYICPSNECLAEATRGKRLQKALEHEIAPEVLATIKQKISELVS